MISAKEAVQAAINYAHEIFDEKPSLEEIEQSEDGKSWLITLSLDDIAAPTILFGAGRPDRRYKTFKIDGESKEVSSVKIRQL